MATTTTPKTKPAKTRKTYTPSERAVRAVLALSLGELVTFCKELDSADVAVSQFVFDKLGKMPKPGASA